MELTQTEKQAGQRIIHAMDGLNTPEEFIQRAQEIGPHVGMLKCGKESDIKLGMPWCLETARKFGAEVFVDLKWKDIPNTMRGAAEGAAMQGAYMFNIHLDGATEAMVKAAVDGAGEYAAKQGVRKPRVIGVTILTSIGLEDLFKFGIQGTVAERVMELARFGHECGIDGVVCSGQELEYLHNAVPEEFLKVVPGISGPNTGAGSDQKRKMGPGEAIQKGATHLVIGRAISGPETYEGKMKGLYDCIKDVEANLK